MKFEKALKKYCDLDIETESDEAILKIDYLYKHLLKKGDTKKEAAEFCSSCFWDIAGSFGA